VTPFKVRVNAPEPDGLLFFGVREGVALLFVEEAEPVLFVEEAERVLFGTYFFRLTGFGFSTTANDAAVSSTGSAFLCSGTLRSKFSASTSLETPSWLLFQYTKPPIAVTANSRNTNNNPISTILRCPDWSGGASSVA
jgi:hypothetical protein